MNADHAEALRLYCRAYAGVEASVAAMVGVDRHGMNLRAQTVAGEQDVRIDFPRPVETTDAVRKVLIEMLAHARTGR